MKSHPSFNSMRRALVAAAIVVSAGSVAALAQSSSSQDSTMTKSRDDSSSTGTSTANTGSSSRDSSDMSATRQANPNDASSMSSGTHSSNKLSWGDRRFVTKAADDGQQEVQIAQLATQKASSPDVKQFAQQLVEQHTQVNQQLMTLASSKNVKVDQEESKDRMYRRLDKATGTDFDREFVEHMVDEHEKDIKMFEKAAKNAKDPEVRQFASSTLEHLREHLSQAQRLQQSIIPTGRTDMESGRSDTSLKDKSSGINDTTSSASGTSTSGMSDKSPAKAGTSSSATPTTR